MGNRLSVLVLAAAGLLCSAPANPAGPSPRRAIHAAPADTVLARVGPRRRVTVGDFHRSWAALDPPERPDSLTPASAREFLDLLIAKEALGERATAEAWVWTRKESLQDEGLRDQLTLRAVLTPRLDAARDSLRRAGRPADETAVGIAARDAFLARVRPAFDDSALARLTVAFRALPRPSSDSGLFAQLRVLGTLPTVAAADSDRVVARTTQGPFRGRDLLDWWAHMNPLVRPRVETPDDLRALVGNALFETDLRREAERDHLDRRPEVAAALARQREGFAVDHFIQREVYQTLPVDSVTIRRFFDANAPRWALPQRVRVVQLVLPTRAEAERMGARLRDRAEVETLIGAKLPEEPLANEATAPRTRFVHDLAASLEPVPFREALAAGTGMVIGPDSTEGGWAVARVLGVVPARLRTFAEARVFAEHDWTREEGERRLRALFTRVRRTMRVQVNERALRSLTAG